MDSWNRLASADAVRGFLTIRDKVSAHAEIRLHNDVYAFFDVAAAGIKWGDLERTILAIQEIVELLGLLVRGSVFAWDALDVQLREAAVVIRFRLLSSLCVNQGPTKCSPTTECRATYALGGRTRLDGD